MLLLLIIIIITIIIIIIIATSILLSSTPRPSFRGRWASWTSAVHNLISGPCKTTRYRFFNFRRSLFDFGVSYFNLRLATFQAEVLLQETACLWNLDVNHVREAWRREGLQKYLFLFNHEREAWKREGLQKYFFFFTIVVYVLIITSLSIVVFHKPLDADESQMVGDHL